MMNRTHLAIGLFFIMFLLSHVVHKTTFIIVALIASVLPDIDCAYSLLGHYKIFRPLQYLSQHRGIFHSLTLCIAISAVLAFYLPIWALPFFLGYSMHLFSDSFTQEGISVFWPFESETRGMIKTGGTIEDGIFLVFALVDFVFLLGLIF